MAIMTWNGTKCNVNHQNEQLILPKNYQIMEHILMKVPEFK